MRERESSIIDLTYMYFSCNTTLLFPRRYYRLRIDYLKIFSYLFADAVVGLVSYWRDKVVRYLDILDDAGRSIVNAKTDTDGRSLCVPLSN